MNIIPNMLVKSTCVEDSLKIKKKDNLTWRLFMYLVQYKQGPIIGSVSSPNALAPLGDQGRISPYAGNINKISSRKMIRIKVQLSICGL